MKKLIGLSALVFFLSMCSTEIDLLDEYEETTVVYGLLDMAQTKQYVRVEKAFLGPENAYIMAQQFDSINYQNEIEVKIERLYNDGLDSYRILDKDTFYDRDPGIFYSPMYVAYSLTDSTGWVNENYTYRVVVTNSRTGNVTRGVCRPIEPTAISYPAVGSFGFVSQAVSFQPTIRWSPVDNASMYQTVMYFKYRERDVNNVWTTKTTVAMTVGNMLATSTSPVEMKFGEDQFYRFVAGQIGPDDNVVERIGDSVTFVVYACGQEMYEYMQINGPSSGIAQEKPLYSNMDNGLGLWSARTSFQRSYTIANPSLDSLSRGHFTCHLKFQDSQGQNLGCQ